MQEDLIQGPPDFKSSVLDHSASTDNNHSQNDQYRTIKACNSSRHYFLLHLPAVKFVSKRFPCWYVSTARYPMLFFNVLIFFISFIPLENQEFYCSKTKVSLSLNFFLLWCSLVLELCTLETLCELFCLKLSLF